MRDARLLLGAIPAEAKVGRAEVSAGIYKAMSRIEDALDLPDEERNTAPGQWLGDPALRS